MCVCVYELRCFFICVCACVCVVNCTRVRACVLGRFFFTHTPHTTHRTPHTHTHTHTHTPSGHLKPFCKLQLTQPGLVFPYTRSSSPPVVVDSLRFFLCVFVYVCVCACVCMCVCCSITNSAGSVCQRHRHRRRVCVSIFICHTTHHTPHTHTQPRSGTSSWSSPFLLPEGDQLREQLV